MRSSANHNIDRSSWCKFSTTIANFIALPVVSFSIQCEV